MQMPRRPVPRFYALVIQIVESGMFVIVTVSTILALLGVARLPVLVT